MEWNRVIDSLLIGRSVGFATRVVQVTLKVSNRLIAQCADPVVATTIDSLDNRSEKYQLKRPISI